jgi:hypothetical protein
LVLGIGYCHCQIIAIALRITSSQHSYVVVCSILLPVVASCQLRITAAYRVCVTDRMSRMARMGAPPAPGPRFPVLGPWAPPGCFSYGGRGAAGEALRLI